MNLIVISIPEYYVPLFALYPKRRAFIMFTCSQRLINYLSSFDDGYFLNVTFFSFIFATQFP